MANSSPLPGERRNEPHASSRDLDHFCDPRPDGRKPCCFTAADSQRLPAIAERAHRRSVAGVLIKDKVNVHFTGLSESAIVLEITCWFESSDSSQYAGTRHALLLAVLEVVEFFSAFAPPKK